MRKILDTMGLGFESRISQGIPISRPVNNSFRVAGLRSQRASDPLRKKERSHTSSLATEENWNGYFWPRISFWAQEFRTRPLGC